MKYHASTWPLALLPHPHEMRDFLIRDYGVTPRSNDETVRAALQAAGHGTEQERAYTRAVLSVHEVHRYEAETGHPF